MIIRKYNILKSLSYGCKWDVGGYTKTFYVVGVKSPFTLSHFGSESENVAVNIFNDVEKIVRQPI